MKLCAALAVWLNMRRRTIVEARELIFRDDRPKRRAAFAQVVRDTRRLHSSLQRFKPFPTRRLIVGPSPETELETAVNEYLDIFGHRLTHTEKKSPLWVVCDSSFTPLIVETLRAAGWRRASVTSGGPATAVLCKVIGTITGEEPERASLATVLRQNVAKTRK